jgi:hypothetical protein
MTLFVPPRVARELAEETQRRQTEALKAISVERGFKWVQDFNRDLDAIEYDLQLVWCPDPAPLDAVACGAHPGRWHVYRPATSGPMSCLALVRNRETGEVQLGGQGDFVEPGSWVFERLKAQDWWNEKVLTERRRCERRLEEARRKREEDERAEFNREMYERYMAVSRTQVSMNRDVPWAQNAAGLRRRGRRG